MTQQVPKSQIFATYVPAASLFIASVISFAVISPWWIGVIFTVLFVLQVIPLLFGAKIISWIDYLKASSSPIYVEINNPEVSHTRRIPRS